MFWIFEILWIIACGGIAIYLFANRGEQWYIDYVGPRLHVLIGIAVAGFVLGATFIIMENFFPDNMKWFRGYGPNDYGHMHTFVTCILIVGALLATRNNVARSVGTVLFSVASLSLAISMSDAWRRYPKTPKETRAVTTTGGALVSRQELRQDTITLVAGMETTVPIPVCRESRATYVVTDTVAIRVNGRADTVYVAPGELPDLGRSVSSLSVTSRTNGMVALTSWKSNHPVCR